MTSLLCITIISLALTACANSQETSTPPLPTGKVEFVQIV